LKAACATSSCGTPAPLQTQALATLPRLSVPTVAAAAQPEVSELAAEVAQLRIEVGTFVATANTRQATGLAEGTFMLRAQVQFLKKNLKEAVAMFSLGH